MNILKENRTAFYVFDARAAAQRIRHICDSVGAGIFAAYAVKANPFFTEELIPFADRFEICSPGEAAICDVSGVPEEKTVISGVYKDPEFIERLIAGSSKRIYTAESLRQLAMLKEFSRKYQKRIPVLLRLTNDSQFGMNEEDITAAVQENCGELEILGIQYFSGTQKTSLKKIQREIRQLDTFLSVLKAECGYIARELEYGPGFPANYFAGDAVDEEILFSGTGEALSSMENRVHITLELGRSVAAYCGEYYTHVVDMKQNNGQNYIITDGGMHQIVYYGQYMGMKIPEISVCGKEELPAEGIYTICGALCSMNDIIAKQVSLPEIEVGDVLRLKNAGAYSVTEGCALFLSREFPAVYLVGTDGCTARVREAVETYPFNSPCTFRAETDNI